LEGEININNKLHEDLNVSDITSSVTKKIELPVKIKNEPLNYCYTKYNSITKIQRPQITVPRERNLGNFYGSGQTYHNHKKHIHISTIYHNLT